MLIYLLSFLLLNNDRLDRADHFAYVLYLTLNFTKDICKHADIRKEETSLHCVCHEVSPL